jgi:hypothetical protein
MNIQIPEGSYEELVAEQGRKLLFSSSAFGIKWSWTSQQSVRYAIC